MRLSTINPGLEWASPGHSILNLVSE